MSFFERFQSGRNRFHAPSPEEGGSVPYLLAHDSSEQNRLDMQHILLKEILQANYLAPLQQPATILDVGSGTGRWAREMAQQFPLAQITGIDVQPGPREAPANTHFLQHDIFDGLPFPEDSFAYVHSRLLVAAIPSVAWADLLREYVRVARPGAWIELLEGGTTFLNPGPHTQQYLVWWDQFSLARGIDTTFTNQLPALLQQLGLEHMQRRTIHAPIGTWGGTIGERYLAMLVSGWGGLKNTFATQLGIDPTDFDQVLHALPQEWEKNHSRYEYIVTFGQVPLAEKQVI